MRKKDKKTQTEKFGIVFIEKEQKKISENIETSNKYFHLNKYIQLFLLIGFLSACILCFVTGFSLPVIEKTLVLVIAILSIMFLITFSLSKRVELIMAIELLLYGLAALYFREEFSNGLTLVTNCLTKNIEQYFGIILPEFQQVKENEAYYVTVFLCFILFLLVGITTYLYVHKMPKIFVVLLGVIIALICLVVGLMPDDIYFMVFAILTVAILGSGVAEKNNPNPVGEKASLFLVLVGCLIMTIVNVSFPAEQYEESIYTRGLKVKMQKAIHGDFRKLFLGKTASGGLNHGKLGSFDTVEFSYDTMLEVQVNKVDTSLYLKGYVGSEYTGNAWKPLSKEKQEEQLKIKDIHNIGMEDIATQGHKLDTFLSTGEKKADFSCAVENILEDRNTFFLPYLSEIETELKEGKIQSKDIDGRKYTVMHYSDREYYIIDGGIYNIANLMQGNLKAQFEKMIDMSLEEYMENERKKNESVKLEDVLPNILPNIGNTMYFENDTVTNDTGIYASVDISEEGQEIYQVLGKFTFLNELADFVYQLDQLQLAEEAYSKFVSENYLEVPKEQKETLEQLIKEDQNLYEQWLIWNGDLSYYSSSDIQTNTWDMWKKVSVVRNYLNSKTTYTLSPGKLPEGEDFVEYFLVKNKKGYCSHYASAATLLLRALGVPARYVEGYVVPERDFYNSNGTYRSQVKDTNAHAWVEIYIEKTGWVATEMTPYYYEPGRGDHVVTPSASPQVSEAAATKEPEEEIETAKPSTTKKPSDSDDNTEKKGQIPAILLQIGFIIGLIIVVFGTIMIRRNIILLLRKKKMSTTQKEAVLYYQQLEALLCTQKYLSSGTQLRSKEAIQSLQISAVTLQEWENLIEIVNQMAFSENGITDQQLDEMKVLYYKVWNEIQQSVSVIRRWYLVYIKVF